MKVGIIGCGAIANIIASSIVPEDNNIDIEYLKAFGVKTETDE